MKTYFTIGETANILNTTASTLRYYDEIGLVHPEFVDAQTGYRYYTLNQFHYIDRIRYLKNIGLPLSQIKEIIKSGSVTMLLPYLRKQKKDYKEEIKNIREKIKDIDWYIDYFEYMDTVKPSSDFYSVKMGERYFAAVPCFEGEETSDSELRLSKLKSQENFKNLKYLRQWNYIIDYNSLVNRQFCPLYITMRMKEKPDFQSENIVIMPEGEYLCFRAKILAGDFGNIISLNSYLQKLGVNPRCVMACEYEDNLKEYVNTPYEIQILI